ncbi:hypothetical protein CR513_15671, partial [Mucuna pruriens]
MGIQLATMLITNPQIIPRLQNPPNSRHQTCRRSSTIHKTPHYLQDYICNTKYPLSMNYDKLSPIYLCFIFNISDHYEPQYYHQPVKFPMWKKAMQDEIKPLEDNNTWTIKLRGNGSVDRYKARLVAKVYTQQACINLLEMFSPAAKLTIVYMEFPLGYDAKGEHLACRLNKSL